MPLGSARVGLLGGSVAIPDSVVFRVSDSDASNVSDDRGHIFETSQKWPDIQARISSNTIPSSSEEMVISDDNGDIAVVDISDQSSGDIVTFSGVNLEAEKTYNIFTRTSGSRSLGFVYDSSGLYDFVSDDGNLSITSGYRSGNSRPNYAYAISEIGNINL